MKWSKALSPIAAIVFALAVVVHVVAGVAAECCKLLILPQQVAAPNQAIKMAWAHKISLTCNALTNLQRPT